MAFIVCSKTCTTYGSASSKIIESGIANRKLETLGACKVISGMPAIMLKLVAQHCTDAANGPDESILYDSGTEPVLGINLAVGLNPVIPQNAAGIRIDPPVSVPNDITDI